jgi:hypothetical protein
VIADPEITVAFPLDPVPHVPDPPVPTVTATLDGDPILVDNDIIPFAIPPPPPPP